MTTAGKFYDGADGRPTQEEQARFVQDWNEWEAQLRHGHPVLDAWLESKTEAAAQRVCATLRNAWRGSVAASYLGYAAEHPRGNIGEELFDLSVGLGNAANWSASDRVKSVGVRFFRPGVAKRRSEGPNPSDVWPMEVIWTSGEPVPRDIPLTRHGSAGNCRHSRFSPPDGVVSCSQEALAEFREVDRIAGGR